MFLSTNHQRHSVSTNHQGFYMAQNYQPHRPIVDLATKHGRIFDDFGHNQFELRSMQPCCHAAMLRVKPPPIVSQALDADKSGQLDHEELKSGLEKLGLRQDAVGWSEPPRVSENWWNSWRDQNWILGWSIVFSTLALFWFWEFELEFRNVQQVQSNLFET